MCGINGFIRFKNIYNEAFMREIVHKMSDKIIHRGPNSEGLYSDFSCSLGMRRLSIIDIEGGGQPIWNENKDKLIIFNGEIYNYKFLKEKLISKGHIFQTNTDTETLLHCFEEYGFECFGKIEGMFACCIYDLKLKRWVIARDRIGEKPLYYHINGEFFMFASELKSILCTSMLKKEICKEALETYFQLTYIPAPQSIISGVYKLPQASYMIINGDGTTDIHKYWQLEISEDRIGNSDYALSKKKLRDLLYKSVENRMVSDVPLGAFLSGGIDSTIIVGIMSDISDEKINTFTIGFDNKQYDESELARIVAKRHGTNHHVLKLDWSQTLKDLDTILENIDEPFADSSYIATYAVSRMAKEYVTVVLTGDAGDEIFAGYDKYLISYYSEKYSKVPYFLRRGIIEPGVKVLPVKSVIRRKVEKVVSASSLDLYEQRKHMMMLGFKGDEIKQLLCQKSNSTLSFIREHYDKWINVSEQTRTQYTDLNVVLEGDMLYKVDRASMLASLETRVPFLDSNIIDFAFNLPEEYKINKKQRKIILKETFNDCIPAEILNASKRGFSVPIGQWLEKELRNKLIEYTDEKFLEEQGLFNKDFIEDLLFSHLCHKENRYSELWTFFVFQNWYARYFM